MKMQRLRRFGDCGLIVDSSTNLEDIPNGDAFKVDDQWVICPLEGGDLEFKVNFECIFHKSVLWKGIIDSRSKTDTHKFYEDWAEAAKKHLYNKRNPRPKKRDRKPRDGKRASRHNRPVMPKKLPDVNVNPKFTIPVIPWLLAILFFTLYWRSQGEVALLRQSQDVAQIQSADARGLEARQLIKTLDGIARRLERLEAKVDAIK